MLSMPTPHPLSGALRALGALALLCAAPRILSAQLSTTVNVAAHSSWVWRGVTFTSRPVVQGDASVTRTTRRGTVTVGLWANAEPMEYDGPTDVSLVVTGHAGPALTAWSPWIEGSRTAGPLAITLGAAGYFYPALTGLASAYNTGEAYVRLAATVPLAPRLALYRDVAKVRGTYAELGASHTIDLGASRSLTVGATTQVSVSQGPTPGVARTVYFAHNGIVAHDVSFGASLPFGEVALAPVVHVSLNRDGATRLRTRADAVPAKVWGGVSLSWTHH
jgi:hypothetical protein